MPETVLGLLPQVQECNYCTHHFSTTFSLSVTCVLFFLRFLHEAVKLAWTSFAAFFALRYDHRFCKHASFTKTADRQNGSLQRESMQIKLRTRRSRVRVGRRANHATLGWKGAVLLRSCLHRLCFDWSKVRSQSRHRTEQTDRTLIKLGTCNHAVCEQKQSWWIVDDIEINTWFES